MTSFTRHWEYSGWICGASMLIHNACQCFIAYMLPIQYPIDRGLTQTKPVKVDIAVLSDVTLIKSLVYVALKRNILLSVWVDRYNAFVLTKASGIDGASNYTSGSPIVAFVNYKLCFTLHSNKTNAMRKIYKLFFSLWHSHATVTSLSNSLMWAIFWHQMLKIQIQKSSMHKK